MKLNKEQILIGNDFVDCNYFYIISFFFGNYICNN